MVMSPNKHRLYVAQEGLIDASDLSRIQISVAIESAIREADEVAAHYAEWDSEKQRHVQTWADELRRLLTTMHAGEIFDYRAAVLAASQRATILDNWFYPEEAPELGFG